jgi:hypothetical protein
MPTAFIDAVAARDHNALVDCLAPDVTVHSAVAHTPFRGREVVADLYAAVLAAFDELQVVDEFPAQGDTYSFFWEGRIDGRPVAGADRVRLNADGQVREVTILGRPLSGVSTFVTTIGPGFARRRRGDAVAKVLRATALPLPALFAAFEPLIRWLCAGRRR